MSSITRTTPTIVQSHSSYSNDETETINKGEDVSNVSIPTQQQGAEAAGDGKPQTLSQKPESKSNARLSELNLSGQLQQMKMRDLENGGVKEKQDLDQENLKLKRTRALSQILQW
jgi:hypothetical protein